MSEEEANSLCQTLWAVTTGQAIILYLRIESRSLGREIILNLGVESRSLGLRRDTDLV